MRPLGLFERNGIETSPGNQETERKTAERGWKNIEVLDQSRSSTSVIIASCSRPAGQDNIEFGSTIVDEAEKWPRIGQVQGWILAILSQR